MRRLGLLDDQVARAADVPRIGVLDQRLREHAVRGRAGRVARVLPAHPELGLARSSPRVPRDDALPLEVGLEAVAQHCLVDVAAGEPGVRRQGVFERDRPDRRGFVGGSGGARDSESEREGACCQPRDHRALIRECAPGVNAPPRKSRRFNGLREELQALRSPPNGVALFPRPA